MPASGSRSGVRKPSLEDKLEAWARAYDAIREHVKETKEWGLAANIESAIVTAAASIVGGIQW